MAEAFRIEVEGWSDSFFLLDDSLTPESVSRPVIGSGSVRTCDRNQRRTIGQKALSLSLKGKGKPVERFSLWILRGCQQEACTKEYHSVGALYFPVVA